MAADARPSIPDWEAPVLKCAASAGEGISELIDQLDAHFAWLTETGMLGEQRRLAAIEHTRRVLERAFQRQAATVWKNWIGDGERAEAFAGSPYEIARRLARSLGPPPGE
jgi:putative protein kinase ArgK-like GTPase of G3E family